MCGNSILEVGPLRWIASVMTLSYCYLAMFKIYHYSLWLEAFYLYYFHCKDDASLCDAAVEITAK